MQYRTVWAAAVVLLAQAMAQGDEVKGVSTTMQPSSGNPCVDFSYAFATPHRMTVARPDSSDKTLLDLEPGNLRVAWTYENLTTYPVAAFTPINATWSMRLRPEVDGHEFKQSTWTRSEGILPVLENRYTDEHAALTIEAAGGATAAVFRLTLANTSNDPVRLSLTCRSERGFFGYNPGYVDADKPRDCLLAGWGDRADRVICAGIGADAFRIADAVALVLDWQLSPGERKTAWIVRPYRAYAADLPALRAHDWEREYEEARSEWRALLGRAVRIDVPDPGVATAYYACLGDCFIMREPVQGGGIAGIPGTECYRAANSGEPLIASVAFDQANLHSEALASIMTLAKLQGEDGDWNDPEGWGHLMWAVSGFKSWAVIEHYRLTQDRAFLEEIYPRMLASSRWQETQRARTRVLTDGERPLTYGLMPRGMGDCGVKDGDDLYGVFLPHNIWAVYADRVSAEAAEILGHRDEAVELRHIFDTAYADLMQSFERGAIQEDGYRWIPGVAGKTSGSRWGVLNALFPCELLAPDHELVAGTIRYIRSRMSPGGLPLNTGWLPDGMWVAIALDNLAEAHLVRDEGDAAADLLYATLNHGTPLYTWCEERGQEPGAKQVTGDRQHLWTPVSVVRAVRDSLIMEDGDGLHLARGTHRAWAEKGVGIDQAPTHFGKVSYHMKWDREAHRVTGTVSFPGPSAMAWCVLHVRLPENARLGSVNAESGATVLPDGSGLRWEAPHGEVSFIADVP